MNTLVLPTDIANNAGLLIRSFILTQFPCWMPFAYTFKDEATVLSSGTSFVESPAVINAACSSLDYSSFGHANIGDVKELTFDVSAGAQLLSTTIVPSQKEPVLIATAQSDTQLTIKFVYASGILAENQNRTRCPAQRQTVVFATRHLSIDNCTYRLENNNDGTTDVIFSDVPDTIFTQACTKLKDLLTI